MRKYVRIIAVIFVAVLAFVAFRNLNFNTKEMFEELTTADASKETVIVEGKPSNTEEKAADIDELKEAEEKPAAKDEKKESKAEEEEIPTVGPLEFNLYATSPLYFEAVGKDVKSAYISLVKAAMSGKDKFKCANQETYDVVMNEAVAYCCPVIGRYISPPASGVGFKDGVGYFSLSIGKDELTNQVDSFGSKVTGILKSVCQESDSNFEKITEMYAYVVRDAGYNFDNDTTNYDGNSLGDAYKVIMENKGYNNDLSAAYAYLLTQLGVDAGKVIYDDGSTRSQWCIVRVQNQCYIVDPAYAMAISPGEVSFSFFMITDGYYTNVYPKTSWNYFTHGNNSAAAAEKYACKDRTYKPYWDMYFNSIDKQSKTIHGGSYDNGGNLVETSREYSADNR